MQWMGSPLAQAGLDEDFQRKTQRLVPNSDGVGETGYTVRDYSEGLEGIALAQLLWASLRAAVRRAPPIAACRLL